jgi:hypothetical protein
MAERYRSIHRSDGCPYRGCVIIRS